MPYAQGDYKVCCVPDCLFAGRPQTLDNFYADCSRRDGLSMRCKTCDSRKQGQYLLDKYGERPQRVFKPEAERRKPLLPSERDERAEARRVGRYDARDRALAAKRAKYREEAALKKAQKQYDTPHAHAPSERSQLHITPNVEAQKQGVLAHWRTPQAISRPRVPCPGDIDGIHFMDCVMDPKTGVITEKCRNCEHSRVIPADLVLW